ncbi:MAG: hypothetical protein M3083_00510 [Actinomycetota bacterium]|nr:hypothetical protein [Actinomycetota bacterium]
MSSTVAKRKLPCSSGDLGQVAAPFHVDRPRNPVLIRSTIGSARCRAGEHRRRRGLGRATTPRRAMLAATVLSVDIHPRSRSSACTLGLP